MLITVRQCQLIDQHTTQSKAASSNQSFVRDVGVSVEDAFEMLVEVLNREGTQLVEDASHLPTCIIARTAASMSSYQTPFSEHTHSPQHRRVVVLISQQIAYVRRQLTL